MLKKTIFRLTATLICWSIFCAFNSPILAIQQDINATLHRIEQELINKNLSKESLTQLISIVHEYPTNSHAHIVLGNCCDFLGLPEQAMEQYKLAFKYGPNNVESFLELVKAQVRAGQVSAASVLLKQAMEKFPTDPQILFWTGNALFKERRFEEARQLYIQAMNKSKKPIVGINSALAHLALLQERYFSAISLAMADLKYDRNQPQANEVIGLSYLRLGKCEQAIPYLAIAYKNDPNNYDLSLSYTYALTWSGQYNQALMPALSALANAQNFSDRARVTKKIEDITPHLSKAAICEAIEQVSRSRNLEKNLYTHQELSKICLQRNLPNQALSEALAAEKIDPSSARAKYQLALVIECSKQDYPLALKYLRQAKAIDPYNYEINQHLLRLEDRLNVGQYDWAWHLKDWLNKQFGLKANP